MLSVEGLEVRYAHRDGALRAVDGVDLTVGRGETVGLVGESGCGKSTLGKAILRLVEPIGGRVAIDGVDVAGLKGDRLLAFRRRVQFVFQDPYASLNPRRTIGEILDGALAVHRLGDRPTRRHRVREILDRVGLPADAVDRLPHEFSGGQRQRIGIARALVLSPDLIVLDEPVSALDVSIQAQILNLLVDLKREFGLAYLFVSHDLSVVRYIADRVLVMYLGRIVECADHHVLFGEPRHPYTRALVDAVPLPDPRRPRAAIVAGDIPSAARPPSGCRFHPRCPLAIGRCADEVPSMREIAPGHAVACHLA
ncbi:ATP-binding cassette domain-containing protein [Siculibacillus lacustris]|uniref:ATP-binding cassette domain-containing protein n=1 Tax=Siculibacillus lacustris TaxID=1549641 RepID=A0A4Q9VTE3_9HYPH|nr:oligopeptide/dipeptide ABC transporter ATP-binding protein [Siculibacillus lacustris]TBW38976.1 ATP-binding cassette domain-containing protein [Siculibacillus lacustris]